MEKMESFLVSFSSFFSFSDVGMGGYAGRGCASASFISLAFCLGLIVLTADGIHVCGGSYVFPWAVRLCYCCPATAGRASLTTAGLHGPSHLCGADTDPHFLTWLCSRTESQEEHILSPHTQCRWEMRRFERPISLIPIHHVPWSFLDNLHVPLVSKVVLILVWDASKGSLSIISSSSYNSAFLELLRTD